MAAKKRARKSTPKSAPTIPPEVMPLSDIPVENKRFALLVVVGIIILASVIGVLVEVSLKPLLAQTPDTLMPPQEVHMTVLAESYEPAVFTVQVGRPVRWIINATNATGCTQSLIAPDIGIRQILTRDETILEFTPREPGKIPFSCAMAMAQGHFEVVP